MGFGLWPVQAHFVPTVGLGWRGMQVDTSLFSSFPPFFCLCSAAFDSLWWWRMRSRRGDNRDLAPMAYGVAAAPGLALWGPVPVVSGGLCAGVLGRLRPLVSSEAPHLVVSCALKVVLGWVPGHSPVLGPHTALSLSTFFPSLQPASHL